MRRAAGAGGAWQMAHGVKQATKWSKCPMRSSRVELVSSSSIDRRYRRLQAAPRGTREGQDARGRNIRASSKDRLMVISPGWQHLSPAMPSQLSPLNATALSAEQQTQSTVTPINKSELSQIPGPRSDWGKRQHLHCVARGRTR